MRHKTIKNRGAVSNPEGRFEKETHEWYDDGWQLEIEDELPMLETTLIEEKGKTIISTNDSPDIGFEQSINPYKGCEHGCIYCYARPSHSYMNLSAGLDFETKIFFKSNAAALFEKTISKARYVCKPVVIGANTDPYQPAEAKLKITRSLLEVADKFQHPVIIITKGSLIERDLDVLARLSEKNLVKVAITITTLSTPLKLILEPRASTPSSRLRVIEKLTKINVPVRVMAAPMIPMINDMELENILTAAKNAGANYAAYTLIRLPHEVKTLFKEWLQTHYKERAEHVMSIIRQMRGGKEYDSSFGKRMSGEGKFAELLGLRFKVICKKLKMNMAGDRGLDTTILKKEAGEEVKQLSLDW